MAVKIKSNEVFVECLQEGAMLHSLVKDGREYLWQGDKSFWAGQAPVCFPIAGVLRDSRAIAFGKECSMKRHGVARINPFEIESVGANYVTFVQNSSEKTKADFPFDYRLEIKYTVVKSTVTTQYTVYNTGKERLPFVIGGHPAFNCPVDKDEAFEDYSVVFDKPINEECLRPDIHSGLIDISKRFKVFDAPGRIDMRHSLFVDDAMVFDGIESKSALLVGKNKRGVRLDYQDFDNLLVWSSANGGPFVALEPWTGISTCSDENSVFENKRGMTVLEAGEQASFKFKITLI